ncbi:MAG: hypothetical protein GTN49_08595 [candidate division Zixibacteria bacterium]|nr:hypothetical protein [candidate division Zixibacteria bacterium]
MRKGIIVMGVLAASATVAVAAKDVSVCLGVWAGEGYRRAAPTFNAAFGIDGKPFGYRLSLDYRKWTAKNKDYGFYMLNFDNYLVVKVTYDNPVDLYFAPLISYGKTPTWKMGPPLEDISHDNIGFGGRFGAVAGFADGEGLVDFYFSYRGGIVVKGNGLDYLVTTKFGVEGHVPLIQSIRLRVSAGGLSDNFGFYEGMVAYSTFGSPFLYLGPEFVF